MSLPQAMVDLQVAAQYLRYRTCLLLPLWSARSALKILPRKGLKPPRREILTQLAIFFPYLASKSLHSALKICNLST